MRIQTRLLAATLLLSALGSAAAPARGWAQGAAPPTPPAPPGSPLPGAAPAPATEPRVESQLNLLVVLSDDHRWDALGAAGNPSIVTPVMDALARSGVYFRQATVSVSQCHPVRASLLTGLPAHRHGVFSNQFQAPGAEEAICRRPTVASALRDAGYRTVLVGKWHVAAPPRECGFDEARSWLPGGHAEYRDPELARGASAAEATVAGFTQEIFADDAVGFLRSAAAREHPFLLWLSFTAPHYPHGPNPPRIAALYADRRDEELLPPGFPRDVPANDWRHYAEAVSHLDEQLGRVLAALRENNLAERTVVVLLGDNGYMMGERGVGGPGSRANGKQVPYESSLRVPFVLAGPGLPAGLVSELPVSSMDLPPTLLSLAGVPVPQTWPGRDLVGALAGRVAVREAFVEWSDEGSERFGALAYRLVRTPTHKLILWKDAARGVELYDLAADAAETRDLASDPAAAAVRRDLAARLVAWMRANDDPALGWESARSLR